MRPYVIGGIIGTLLYFLGSYIVTDWKDSGIRVIAEEHIKNRLRAPSTYINISKDIVWKGKYKNYNTYVVRIEYEAMNGLGGRDRDCHYMAVFDSNGKYPYKEGKYDKSCSEIETSLMIDNIPVNNENGGSYMAKINFDNN